MLVLFIEDNKDNGLIIKHLSTTNDLDMIIQTLADIRDGNIVYKKCAYCGKEFQPSKRSDEKYCNRVVKYAPNGSVKTCKDIGAISNYVSKINNDPVLSAYRKAYKKLHARIRTGKITEHDFKQWSIHSKYALKMAKEGKITLEQMIKDIEI